MMSRGVAVVLLLAAAVGFLACSAELELDEPRDTSALQTRSPRNPPASGAGRPVAAQSGYKGTLPPVPESPHAAAAPDVIKAIYEFAARRPDVLRYVPCFCGCERNGHQDNEDCFVAKRDADGRPHWDAHGLT